MSQPGLRRLALLISSLGAGGAERVMTTLANHWAGLGLEVAVITMAVPASDFYALRPEVRRVSLNNLKEHVNPPLNPLIHLGLLRDVRNALRGLQPQVGLSFMTPANMLNIVAARWAGVPIVISERSDPYIYPPQRLMRWMRRLIYPWANLLVCQHPAQMAYFRGWGIPRVAVVSNPVHSPSAPRSRLAVGPGLVLAVGRLAPSKGFDMLIKAFASARRPGWRLLILGEGPERVNLEALIRDLDLGDWVELPGTEQDIWHRYQQADFLVLSSRFEGMPNVVLEAMSTGLPVVATNCTPSMSDLVHPEVDGFLVPPEDTAALAHAMARLMDDPQLRLRMGQKARLAIEPYGLEAISHQWLELLAWAATGA